MSDRLEALRNALLFEEVPVAELRAAAALVRTLELRAGEALAVRGKPLAGMVMLEEGALELLLDSSPICSLSPGSVFCEDALVTDALAPATVRAAASSRVAILERSSLTGELLRLPQLRRALEQAWRRRVLAAGLYQIDLFQALSAEARARLLERFEQIELPPGAVLATEGEPGDTFTFIRAGEAQLRFESAPDGSQAAPLEELAPAAAGSAVLRAGDYLGDGALVDDSPHTATATSAAGLTAMQLSRAQFEEALSALPGQLEEAKAAFQRRSEGFF